MRALKLILLILVEIGPIIDDVATYFERRRQERKFKKSLRNGHDINLPPQTQAHDDPKKSDHTVD